MEENNTSLDFTPFSDERTTNKRKLKILSQTPEEMVVEISRLEEIENASANAINATNLNSRFNEMKEALQSIVNEKTGTVVSVKNAQGIYEATDISFDSDPQTQITNEATTRANIDNSLQTQINNIWDKIYPIGSIYMSVSTTSPAVLFGGTWQALQDRFLLGSGTEYLLNEIGGEKTHTLTEQEMPYHTHIQNPHRHRVLSGNGKTGNAAGIGYDWNYGIGGCDNDQSARNWYDRSGNSSGANPLIEDVTATNQHAGGKDKVTQPHNNLPPYLVVNMWKRTT